MRRHLDGLVMKRRSRLWRAIHGFDREPGRFKKFSIGCRVARCGLCKGHKIPKRTPTRKEQINECFERFV